MNTRQQKSNLANPAFSTLPNKSGLTTRKLIISISDIKNKFPRCITLSDNSAGCSKHDVYEKLTAMGIIC